ncbi:MAG: arsenate reductase ArsC [Bacteroidetes bacterium]|nr:arsenate reductase ArsC [Bacteroidota bacterium]MBL6942868.1 arsenate reductase ArsC [Bacteroidales bacterium]
MKILILCTGNSCRSQMVEGFLKSFDKSLNVVSAGTQPGLKVHPLAIKVMEELNIDISNNRPKSVVDFLSDEFDYVITVCGDANENCPVFTGKVKHRLHIGFDDPAETTGTDDEIMKEFIRIRNEIERDFRKFYNEQLDSKISINKRKSNDK